MAVLFDRRDELVLRSKLYGQNVNTDKSIHAHPKAKRAGAEPKVSKS